MSLFRKDNTATHDIRERRLACGVWGESLLRDSALHATCRRRRHGFSGFRGVVVVAVRCALWCVRDAHDDVAASLAMRAPARPMLQLLLLLRFASASAALETCVRYVCQKSVGTVPSVGPGVVYSYRCCCCCIFPLYESVVGGRAGFASCVVSCAVV